MMNTTKRFVIATLGGFALVNLLATAGAELLIMSGVNPWELDQRVSSEDVVLMLVCVWTVALTGLLLLGAYVDQLLLGERYPNADLYAAAVATAVFAGWILVQVMPLGGHPVFKSYISVHFGILSSGVVAGVLLILLSRVKRTSPA